MRRRIINPHLSSEVAIMGWVARKPMEGLRLVLAVLATTGMELDVLCNPFSSLQILRWLQPSDADEATAGNPGDSIFRDAEGRATSAAEDTHAGKRPAKKRLRLEKPAEAHDLIAVRSKTRLSSFLPASVGTQILPLDLSMLGGGPRHDPRHLDPLLQRLCRLRC
jgi:hypothetical protein